MQYAILFYETEADFAKRESPEAEAYWGAWMAYTKSMKDAGVMKDGMCLQPPTTGTSVRMKIGARKVQDGPFADAKEQLGGLTVIDVPNLDAALEWAARAPSASPAGAEVRPMVGCDD
jgi:hypothetical protein